MNKFRVVYTVQQEYTVWANNSSEALLPTSDIPNFYETLSIDDLGGLSIAIGDVVYYFNPTLDFIQQGTVRAINYISPTNVRVMVRFLNSNTDTLFVFPEQESLLYDSLDALQEYLARNVVITNPTFPLPPSNVVYTNRTVTSFNLSWSPSATATSYNVYLNGVLVLANVVSTTAHISGLVANTQYGIEVEAVNTVGPSATKSPVIYVETLPLAPEVPTNINITNLGPTSFTVNWLNSPNAEFYSLFANSELVANNLDVTNYTLEGLNPLTQYIIQVRASNISGNSALSEPITVQTYPNTPAAPTGGIATDVTASSFILSWNNVFGASSYNIYDDSTLLANTVFTNYFVDSLPPNTSKIYNITAVNLGGESEFSNNISVTTLLNAPTDLTADSVNSTNVSLIWEAVPEAITYNIYQDAVLIASTADTSFLVEGLNPLTDYTFAVSAVNSTGESDRTPSIFVQTLN